MGSSLGSDSYDDEGKDKDDGEEYDMLPLKDISPSPSSFTSRKLHIIGIVAALFLVLASSLYLLSASLDESRRPLSLPFISGIFGDSAGVPSSSEGVAGKPLPKVYLMVPVNEAKARDEDRRFCRVMQGAIVYGWRPIVFNWEVTEGFQKAKPFGLAKLLNSPEHTSQFAEDDLILLVDALDVWLQVPPNVMARRFLEQDKSILVSAEKNCWPNPRDGHACMDAPVSPMRPGIFGDDGDYIGVDSLERIDLAPRHANSGSIMGAFSAMRAFFNELVEFMDSEAYDGYDDQGAFNIFVADGKLHADHYSRLFWAAHDDYENMKYLGTRYPPDPSFDPEGSKGWQRDTVPWELYPPLGHHALVGQVPGVIHFNGGSKPLLEEWWGSIWWQQADRRRFTGLIRERMEDGYLTLNTKEGYERLSVKDVCPMLDVWNVDRDEVGVSATTDVDPT